MIVAGVLPNCSRSTVARGVGSAFIRAFRWYYLCNVYPNAILNSTLGWIAFGKKQAFPTTNETRAHPVGDFIRFFFCLFVLHLNANYGNHTLVYVTIYNKWLTIAEGERKKTVSYVTPVRFRSNGRPHCCAPVPEELHSLPGGTIRGIPLPLRAITPPPRGAVGSFLWEFNVNRSTNSYRWKPHSDGQHFASCGLLSSRTCSLCLTRSLSLSEHRKDTCQTRKTRYRSRKCDKMARHAHKGKLIYLQHRVRVEGVGAHSAAEEFSVTGQAAAGHGLVLCGREASSSQAGKKLCDNRRGTHTHTSLQWLAWLCGRLVVRRCGQCRLFFLALHTFSTMLREAKNKMGLVSNAAVLASGC